MNRWIVLEVFQGSYGYDRNISSRSYSELGWADEEDCVQTVTRAILDQDINLRVRIVSNPPKKIVEYFKNENLDFTKLSFYCYPSDEFNDSHFLKFVKSKHKEFDTEVTYRSAQVVTRNKMRKSAFTDLWLGALDRFFSESKNEDTELTANQGRNSSIFRLIEMNEFYHLGKDNETFRDYLESNVESISEVCKDLRFKKHSKKSEVFINSPLTDADFTNEELKSKILGLTGVSFQDFIMSIQYCKGQVRRANTFMPATQFIIMQLDKIIEGAYKGISEEKIIDAKLTKSLFSSNTFEKYMAENEYKSDSLRDLSRIIKNFSSDKVIDLHFYNTFIEKAIENLSVDETIRLIKGINSYVSYSADYSLAKLTCIYTAVKKEIISVERLSELLLNLPFKPSRATKSVILDLDFFNSISNEDMPIEWALETTGLLQELRL